MALRPLAVAVALAAAASTLVAQEGSWVFSAGVRGSLTTSAKLFFLPNDSSEIVRSQFDELTGVYGAALEVRARPVGSSFFFSLSVEYQRQTRERDQLVAFTTPPSVVPTEDGYWMIPVEASVNVDVPLGSDSFGLAMGAGAGVYYAERVMSVVGVAAVPVKVKPAIGLHVRVSAEYHVTPGLSVVGELRFRNPQISTVNQFQESSSTIDNVVVHFPQEEIPGRLDIDGMVVGLGVVVVLR